MIIEYAREVLHMTSINILVITGHIKSIALLERNGFVRKELLENDTENKLTM
jgi:RimJ/RimL family protein N-acetyltransferase